MSGNGAAANIEGFIYVLMNSFHQTAVNFIGQNMGAHQYDRIKKIFGICALYVSAAGLMNGSDGRFRPGDPVTRAEIATLLQRMDDMK